MDPGRNGIARPSGEDLRLLGLLLVLFRLCVWPMLFVAVFDEENGKLADIRNRVRKRSREHRIRRKGYAGVPTLDIYTRI